MLWPASDAKHLASIDDFVNHEISRQRIPGLELGIYSRGRILPAKVYGLANVELNVPETVMQSGSVGKAASKSESRARPVGSRIE